jgi:hypothetical protein
MFQLLKGHHQAIKFKDYLQTAVTCAPVQLVTGSHTALHCMLLEIYVKSNVTIKTEMELRQTLILTAKVCR